MKALFAAVVVAALGIIGLVLSTGTHASPHLTVSGAYVRPPVPPNDSAAVYFAVDNPTDHADSLQSVTASVGRIAVLHDGGMTRSGALPIPAQDHVVLSVGHGHVMLEKVPPGLHTGRRVELTLTFAHAGAVRVSAPVLDFGVAPPTEGTDS